MALHLPVAELIESIGHDGSEIIWPELPEPMRRRGFHSQELIDECLKRKCACTPVERSPSIGPSSGDGAHPVYTPARDLDRFGTALRYPNTVIECSGRRCRHTVHGEYGHIYDPRGVDYDFTDFGDLKLEPFRIWIINS